MSVAYSQLSRSSASRIAPRHWQGGLPDHLDQLHAEGFNALILCAQELQPEGDDADVICPGVDIVCAPLDDADITEEEITLANEAAREVTKRIKKGQRVLITCQQGRNRSGLVSALALVHRYGISGHDALAIIRTHRKDALTNPSFVAFLEQIQAH